ncbi:MAG: hypothetical protein KDD52_08255 [Bdellovibrionales bacterium]|nr:hypothetical protein [Bdellovibrionales bacterium]
MKHNISFFVALICFSMSAHAQTLPYEGPNLNRKVRNLGMGNVGVSLSGQHDSAAFYNPAGLNDLKKGKFQFFSPTFELSKSFFDLVSEIQDLTDEIKDANNDADKTRAFNDFLSARTGQYDHVRASFELISYTRKNFAVGLLFDERIDMSFRDQSFPHFEVRNLGDVSMYVAGAYDFWEQLLQVGITLRPTVRFALDQEDEIITLSDILGDDAQGNSLIETQVKKVYQETRFGMGVDLGLKSNLSFLEDFVPELYKKLNPQAGFSWQDIGSPSFGAGPDNPQIISMGLSIEPSLWILDNTFAVEMRDMNLPRPFLSKLHIGLESRLPKDILALRLGLSEGYFSTGLGIDLGLVSIDGALYINEIGRNTREAGSMRFATNISFKI